MYTTISLLLAASLSLTLFQFSSVVSQQTNERSNEVVFVDLQINENIARHRTSLYRQMTRPAAHSPKGPSIVVRRGEPLNVTLHLQQAYSKDTDRYRLEFSFGPQPRLDRGTLYYLPLQQPILSNNGTSSHDPYKWGARIQQIDGKQLKVRIDFPAIVAIGVWRLKISSKQTGSKKLRTYSVREAFYVIFNPWSRGDAVYLFRDDAKKEYVLSDVGKIYVGSYSRPVGRKWVYGQFHEAVLPAMMLLLDKTRLDVYDRGDVVKVARAVSAIVNSNDENGLLVGDWSGNYGDGLAPWQWTGSAVIFEKYLQTGHSVKFGQCWVFGGVATTALRTLGIPARTISNFVSAHDTDSSLTVDKFYSERGESMGNVNTDSIWNFHVWSDAWMARYDLPKGFGGWQAIDATPQEKSMGSYQVGPASLEAIKQGKVSFAYDVGFVFAEVNADLVYWHRDSNRRFQWRKSTTQTDHMGRKILTKFIGALDERSTYGVQDAENIVNQYKHNENSKEERQAFYEAVRSAGLNPLFD